MLGTAAATFLGGWALDLGKEKVGEALLGGLGQTLNPSEIDRLVGGAIAQANESVPQLFYSCERDGSKGSRAFLANFCKGRALSELQKPLKNEGNAKPDAKLLTEAFVKSASDCSIIERLNQSFVAPWVAAFVEAYFQETNSALRFRVTRADYCNQILRAFDDVKFAGIATEGKDVDRAQRLADIFVMPDLQADEQKVRGVLESDFAEAASDPQQRLMFEQRQQMMRLKERTSGEKISAADLFKHRPKNRAVLLGAPGSGKTTLMNFFAVQNATPAADTNKDLEKDTNITPKALPLLIRIRDLARQPDLSVIEFVQYFAEKDLSISRDLSGFFEHYLDRGDALILLDGLDEVADLAQRYKVVDKIEAFLTRFDRCPAIITSRPAGYRRDFFRTDEYPHYELQPFDDKKIDIFIEYWYNSRFELESERERRKESLRKALSSQPRIKQLARNPLLLTIIALIHRYQATLPKERYKLYDKAVETLLTTWDSNKELTNHEILKYLKIDDLRRLMERLAYWIHCQGETGDAEGGTLIDRGELISRLTQYIKEMKRVERYEARAEAKRFLELVVRDRAGLLSRQGQDRYAFVHKTFQEYLAAMEIRDRQEDGFSVVLEHIEEHLHNPHWEEVLLLLVAQQKRKNPVKILRAVLQHNAPYESWLHRNLLFAANILAEDVPVTDTELAATVIQKLFELEVSKSSLVSRQLKSSIIQAIGNLTETSFDYIALNYLNSHKNELTSQRFLEYQLALEPEKEGNLVLESLISGDKTRYSYLGEEAVSRQIKRANSTFVASLVSTLEHSDAAVRSEAARILGLIDRGKSEFSLVISKLIKDESVDVRLTAIWVLNKSEKFRDTAFNSLLELLEDSDPKVRSEAAEVLNEFGYVNQRATEAILRLLKDNNEYVRSSGVGALGLLNKHSQSVINALIKLLLHDPDPLPRLAAAEVLGKTNSSNDKAISSLLIAIDDEDFEVGYVAFNSLRQLGFGKQAVLKINDLLNSDVEDVRDCAVSVVSQLEIDAIDETVVNNIQRLLHDKSAQVRHRATETLLYSGFNSPHITTTLLQLLEDNDEGIRYQTTKTILRFRYSDSSIIEALRPLLEDESLKVRSCGAMILPVLGYLDQNIINILCQALKSTDGEIRYEAAEFIGRLGQANVDIINSLVELLKDNSYPKRQFDGSVGQKSTISLIELGKKLDNIEPIIVRWIKQNQNEVFVSRGIDILRAIVG